MKLSLRPAHLVTTVVTICAAALLAPVAVSADTGNDVLIVDKVHPTSKARVTAKGTVWVNETDPYTGTVSRVDAAGQRLVAATMANPVLPLDTGVDLTLHSGDTRRRMFSGVGPRKVSLTSLVASAEGASAGSVRLLVIAYVRPDAASGDCETLTGFSGAERFTVMVPVGETVNVTWPTPLVWTGTADGDDYFCVDVESKGGPSGYTAHVSAFGFRT